MRSELRSSSPRVFTILVVDDNRHGLAARKGVLEELGCQVTACTCPHEALAAAADGHFDLIVTDYRMPKMNGIELIKEIRTTRGEVPIILISGMVEPLGLNELNTGADVVIAKSNIEVQHMVRAVNRYLKRKTPKKTARKHSIVRDDAGAQSR